MMVAGLRSTSYSRVLQGKSLFFVKESGGFDGLGGFSSTSEMAILSAKNNCANILNIANTLADIDFFRWVSADPVHSSALLSVREGKLSASAN